MPKQNKSKKSLDKKAFVIKLLRRASYRWPGRSAAVKKARVSRGIYRCNQCQRDFHRSEIQVDHIEPVVRLEGFTNFDDYIERMLCDPEGFQILCKPCHAVKTDAENVIRKLNKKKKGRLTKRRK